MTPQQFSQLPLHRRFRLFTQWLGNQPEDRRYVFLSIDNCALCQFAHTFEGEYLDICAGTNALAFFVNGSWLEIEVVPQSRLFGLRWGRFGSAYNSLAKAAGLPRRSQWRKSLCQLASRFVKHKHALAA